ncbi:MAG: glycine--tRNA ligase subunit beta [Alphaproteobacteria bacterium]|nr:glycine--tRNA ligase subunit beta [Alphaproteobacteria bacterium]MBT5390480.1 glycine--tRNA ligase subunit beta [Alphaproteobacteria bacterium]MBT5541128.1 glycine--tRNA ligase subunit beta [Alphaproteobacteria bacterium]MBT5654967.1 glycine--tRNA ligase subunit beta [Alphaproteobacteria bacterium]
MAEFLLEIRSEEIPARLQKRAREDLKRLLSEKLNGAQLSFTGLETYVTPRRLTAVVEGLPTMQEDRTEEVRGPRTDAPESAAQGFLKSLGVTRDQCLQKETPKGTFLYFLKEIKGEKTQTLLPGIVTEIIQDFPWPKSMRWGSGTMVWIRPIHSILTIFDGDTVSFGIEGIESGNKTRGHRFLAPQEFVVTSFKDYKQKIAKAYVVLDPEKRQNQIEKQVKDLVKEQGLTLKKDPGLLEEVTGLVEWPMSFMGAIDDSFMSLPQEVLTTAMKVHQRFFSVENQDKSLAPFFCVTSNNEPKDGGKSIVHGNEEVLKARLADAVFFWKLDRKTSLTDHLESLKSRQFYRGLGSIFDKAQRLQLLAKGYLGQSLSKEKPGLLKPMEEASFLSKADLATEVVGEFPELQGIMGYYYALSEKRSLEVAEAIRDQYRLEGPQGEGDAFLVGAAVYIADKIDTLVGFFALGVQPTGSKDPFALRRASITLINLIRQLGFPIDVKELIADSFKAYAPIFKTLSKPPRTLKETTDDLLSFFADRIKIYLKDERNIRHDMTSACLSKNWEGIILNSLNLADALSTFLGTEDGENLLTAYRRATNIIKSEIKKGALNPQDLTAAPVDLELLADEEEHALVKALMDCKSKLDPLVKQEVPSYKQGMKHLAQLRAPVDVFFDTVLVNAEDEKIRLNRLRLLFLIQETLEQVADFSQIEG